MDQDVGLDIDSINLGSPPAIIPVEKCSHTYFSPSKTNSVSEVFEVSEVSVDTSRGRRVSMDSSSTEGSSIFVQQVRVREGKRIRGVYSRSCIHDHTLPYVSLCFRFFTRRSRPSSTTATPPLSPPLILKKYTGITQA